uniref:Uncharacterized protein n=1 Tax=Arundo donax TaxID=35708 RepID=A0A0A9ET69_ARUDO
MKKTFLCIKEMFFTNQTRGSISYLCTVVQP